MNKEDTYKQFEAVFEAVVNARKLLGEFESMEYTENIEADELESVLYDVGINRSVINNSLTKASNYTGSALLELNRIKRELRLPN